MPSPRAPLAILLVSLSAVVGSATCGLAPHDEAISLERIATEGLGFEISLGLLAFAGAVLALGNPLHRLAFHRGRLSLAQNLLLVAGTLAASAALDAVLDIAHLKADSALQDFERIVSGARGGGLLLSLLAFVVAPAICEELLCRGLLQRGLVRRIGAPGGIALASLIFGALHLDPIHAAAASFLGVYIGIAFHLAGSVRTPIACHFANNLLALLSSVFFPAVSGGLAVAGFGGAASIAVLGSVWRSAGGPPESRSGATPGAGKASQIHS